jgi:hypothetical protein
MDQSITIPTEQPSDNGFLFVLARLLAAAGAVALCWLLYRFAKGFWSNYTRSGRRPDRRLFSGRKDIAYSRLGTGLEPYQDQDQEEDEGYHDDSVLSRPKSWVNTNRPLPDKPLPPLPTSDAI